MFEICYPNGHSFRARSGMGAIKRVFGGSSYLMFSRDPNSPYVASVIDKNGSVIAELVKDASSIEWANKYF